MKKTNSKNRYNKKRILLLGVGTCATAIIIFNTLISNAFNSNDKSYNKEKVQSKKIVLIDAGHGGYDPGTSNSKTGTVEKNITIKIADKVNDILSKNKEIEVVKTRSSDKYISLKERNNIELKNKADLFVSIHANASFDGSEQPNGIETFYFKDDNNKSFTLAQKINSSISSTIDTRDRGVKKENYSVLRNSHSPSVLIETGFLTNPEEEKKLLSEKYQSNLAQAIANGILDYLNTTTVENKITNK